MRPSFLHDTFDEVTALLLLAAAIGAVALRLRQPLIVGFIVVGILLGPSGLGWVQAAEQLHFLGELGLALLLFVVGLRLDVGLIRSIGLVAVATGLGQVVFTAAIGYFIALGLGLSSTASLYVAIAISFSSTIVVVKLLSDKREADSLHGRIAIGILIVQDILVVFAMIILTALGSPSGGDIAHLVLVIVLKGIALLFALAMLMYLVLPPLLNQLARSTELLLLFAIAYAVVWANVSGMVGFSKEVGAFLAGVSLASTLYREAIAARLVTLRDFLLIFFFFQLGATLNLSQIGSQVWAAIPLSLFVLVGKPLLVTSIMGLLGYRKHTGFQTGVSLAQISEFSLILAALGLSLGHITDATVGLITLVAMVTIAFSTYMIIYSHNIYDCISRYLRVFERRTPFREHLEDTGGRISAQPNIILFGLGRFGSNVGQNLIAKQRRVLGVDFDPQAVRRWSRRGWPARYGDAEDPEFTIELPLSTSRWVISSVRDMHINKVLLNALCSYNYGGNIAMTANTPDDAEKLRQAGADVVLVPYRDAASQAVDILLDAEREETRRKMDKVIANLRGHHIVCGYGRMGKQVVRDFQANNVPFVVVEWNSEQIPHLLEGSIPFIEGKATEDEVLIQAGIERAKGLVAVTATDEENVFIVLTARGLNPDLYIVARSIQEENEGKLRRAGADEVLSPYVLGGHRISAAVLKPRIIDLLELVMHSKEYDLDIANIMLSGSAPFVDKSIDDTGLHKSTGATVIAVYRPGEKLYPNPASAFVVRAGDELMVMGSAEQIEAARRLAEGG